MPKIATVSMIDGKRLLPGVLSFIDNALSHLDFPQAKLLKFRIACETMIADRIENAYSNGGTLDIDITLTANFFEVSVRDMGAPYWRGGVGYDPKNVDEDATGLETFLIANMCDRSGTEKLGRNGQRAFVQLNFPSPLDAESMDRRRKNTSDQRAPDSVVVSIRETSANEKDINSAITCIYDEYKYSYGYERLYYPEIFKELLSAKKLQSFLAVGDNGEIAGHYCLSTSDDLPGMPEWATVVVRRPFRGRHIFDRMCGHGVEMAKSAGARAVMMQPTAYHTATQRVAEKYGFTATGFLFQYTNSDLESEYNPDNRRLDLAIAVKFLSENPKGRAYIPEEHSEIIKGIYKRLGAEYEFPKAFQPEQETCIKHEANALMKSGRVVLTRAGVDFEQELSFVTGDLRRNSAEVVEMLINMSDPAAPLAYEAAGRCGYFFTGIMPGSESGDFLVMQNLFWGKVDAQTIATTGEYTELLRYLAENVDCIKGGE